MKILVWEVRTSKGFTLMELSKKSGIGKSTINNIENGKVSPTLFQLEMIAIALGVNITDLFESEYNAARFRQQEERFPQLWKSTSIFPQSWKYMIQCNSERGWCLP